LTAVNKSKNGGPMHASAFLTRSGSKIIKTDGGQSGSSRRRGSRQQPSDRFVSGDAEERAFELLQEIRRQ
jgi:hypothetical protein